MASSRDRSSGLYRKYHVTRTDGAGHMGGDKFFVLNYGKCKHSRAALEAFADSCAEELPLLAKDIYRELYADSCGTPPPTAATGSLSSGVERAENIL